MTDENDIPPRLPYRCGTMMMEMTPEQWDANAKYHWEKEQAYIDWVRAHPAPKLEWQDTVKRLEESRVMLAAANDPNTTLGKVFRALADAPPDCPSAEVVVLADWRAEKGGGSCSSN